MNDPSNYAYQGFTVLGTKSSRETFHYVSMREYKGRGINGNDSPLRK